MRAESLPLSQEPSAGPPAKAIGRVRRVLDWFGRVLPRGNTLPPQSWMRRHHVIIIVLWGHVAVLPFVGVATGHGLGHSLLEAGVVGLFALGASTAKLPNPARAVSATIGLISSSAILTHFSGGLIEMHFHFFVVVAIVTLYQSWLPFAVAISYVLVHHGVVGALDSAAVYNHPGAVASPWKWALVHAAFIAAESAACLTAWKLNEDALQGERRVRMDLQKANRDLSEAQQLARIGSWEWVPSTDHVWWSDELYRIFGFDPQVDNPSLQVFVDILHPDDRESMLQLMESIRSGATNNTAVDVRIIRADGETRVLRCLGEAEDGGIGRLMGTCQDITEQKQLEAEVEFNALYDRLTGLSNRAVFMDRARLALKGRRSAGLVSALFVDLDDFKSVNDSLGAGAGDELLQEVAGRLEGVLRPGDTIARLGSDEFVILLESADVRIASQVATRLQEVLLPPVVVAGQHVVARASIGIAVSDGNTTPESLLQDADIAMHEVKATGKNGVRVCNADMRVAVVRRQQLKGELEGAIGRNEFTLHFQPIVDLKTRKPVGAEALVRWDHPDWGLVPPPEFIGLAEESGLIVPLGAWILQEATRHARALQDAAQQPFTMSVNLSAVQLNDPNLVATVRAALDASGLAPDDLILEITETVLAGENDSSIRALEELRALGIKIAIDDFGTGYSTLSYLYRFPLDILKIDREFVSTLTKGPDELAVVQTLIELASVLDLRTVAEGIETEQQVHLLTELRCGGGQGYLFSRPLAPESLQQWLRREAAGDLASAT